MRSLLALVVVAMLCAGRPARARCTDDPIASIAVTLVSPAAYLANVIPASGGIDVDVRTGNVRGVIGWPLQFPIGGSGWQSIVPPCDAIHRIVVSPELTIGRETPAVTDVRAGFDLRVGYRAVLYPKAPYVGLLVGAGATFEAAPVLRAPALSPEIGLHLGKQTEYGYLTAIVRGDFFLDGDQAIRIGLAIGWTYL